MSNTTSTFIIPDITLKIASNNCLDLSGSQEQQQGLIDCLLFWPMQRKTIQFKAQSNNTLNLPS